LDNSKIHDSNSAAASRKSDGEGNLFTIGAPLGVLNAYQRPQRIIRWFGNADCSKVDSLIGCGLCQAQAIPAHGSGDGFIFWRRKCAWL